MNIQDLYDRLEAGRIVIDYKHHQVNPLTMTLGASIRHFRELAQEKDDQIARQVSDEFFGRQIEYFQPITGGVADSLSHYCFHCGRRLYMVMTDETHLSFVETDDYRQIPPERRCEGVNPRDYIPCECKDLVKQGKLTADIDIPTGNLVFANFFTPDEIYTDPQEPHSINATLGRNRLMQYLAGKNVGYGQMGNMSVHLYLKDDGTEIIVGPEYKYDAEGRESKVEFEGFTYAGRVSCSVWRWQCADKALLDQYADPYPSSCGKPEYVEIPVKKGKWRIDHFFEFATDEDYGKGVPYSRLKLISEQTGPYSLASLKAVNVSYDYEHGVWQSDVDKANRLIALIESTRSQTVPRAGDMLRYTDDHGDFYGRAHIEYNRDGTCNICEQSSIPFIWPDRENPGIICSTGGGAWANLKTPELKYIGKEKRYFQDWGHCGACGNGAFHFQAEVSMWEYVHPEPIYEDYTTEKWYKMYVSMWSEEKPDEHNGYLYTAKAALASGGCGGKAFKSEAEYRKFLKDYKAKEFPGNWPNQTVVFCYREDRTRISQERYDQLQLPTTTIYCNGERSAKMEYDDENKIIHLYYV